MKASTKILTKTVTKSLLLLAQVITFAACSSVHQSSTNTAPLSPPYPALSGSSTSMPLNQDQMRSMMDRCMSLHKDTGICNQRLTQDCQVSTDATSCQNMLKNINILEPQ